MKRRALLAGSASAAVVGLSGCLGPLFGQTVSDSFEDSYDVSDETTLRVSNRNGDVTVSETSDDRLTVSGTKRASSESALDDISVDVTTGEQFVVEVSFGPGSNFDSRSVELTVEVPEAVTVDGASTANGDVTVDGVAGDVTATTSNGKVEVTDVAGYVRCESSNGDVRARETTGLRGARTSNGTVDVDLLGMREDVTCKSTNGDVTVRVGPEVAADFELSTSNGDASVLHLDHTVSTSRDSYIEGAIGDGGSYRLTIESSNGDVTLRPVTE